MEINIEKLKKVRWGYLLLGVILLRLGLIGPEYKNVRMHLLKNLPGDKAWRYDKSQYPSNQPRPRTDEAR